MNEKIIKFIRDSNWNIGVASWVEGDGTTFFLIKNDGAVYGQGDYQKSIGYLNIKDLTANEKHNIFNNLRKANNNDLLQASSCWLNDSSKVLNNKIIKEYYSNVPMEEFIISCSLDIVIPLDNELKSAIIPSFTKFKNKWDYELKEDINVLVFNDKNELENKVLYKGTVVKGNNISNSIPFICNIDSPFNTENSFQVYAEQIKLVDKNHPYFVNPNISDIKRPKTKI